MTQERTGELVPNGGGDNISLIRDRLTIGRRESCDICLRFPNISGMHCELIFQDGYWIIRDLGSTNGVKVNGTKVKQKILRDGDTITIANRVFTIQYQMMRDVPNSLQEILEDEENIMGQSLLEKAGLERRARDGDITPHVPRAKAGPMYSLEDE
ncbi:MAG TPA: FHA domain-containing protein [Gemmataceae bacterium]|nr:FHA domain-containing protein [Gemmataceae bacterium]